MSSLAVGLEEKLAETVTQSNRQATQHTYLSKKDAFAYFGPVALMRRPKVKQVIRANGTSLSGAMIDQITMRFPVGAGGASLNRNS